MGLLGSNVVSSQLISAAKTPRRGSLSPIACAYEYNTKDASVLKVTDCAARPVAACPSQPECPRRSRLLPRLAGPNNRPGSGQFSPSPIIPSFPFLACFLPSSRTLRSAPGCLTACPLVAALSVQNSHPGLWPASTQCLRARRQ